ncbi:MAG: serine hydrolase domain-containing protein [Phenylobacterium sp.]
MGIRTTTAVLAAAVALGAGPGVAAPAFGPAAAEAIDRAAARQIESGAAPGLAIEVVQDGKVVFSRAYGKANLEWGIPATPDTVFRIASNTKAFTAASVLILVERGKLSLDDKVATYLPDFPRAGDVTVRQLLTHTSGLATYDETYHGKPELAVQRTTPEMLGLIRGLQPLYDFEPGTAYRYSNSGYYVLGAIVEKVSGQPLGQFMADNIFKPLGLRNTAMDEAQDIVPHRAAGYERDSTRPGGYRNAAEIPYTTPGPAGGLRSTVGDLTHWYEALFSGKLVSRPLLAEMTTPARLKDGRVTSQGLWAAPGRSAPPIPPYEYGFGIRISNLQGHREYWHSGAIEGFTSQLRTYPDDKVTIALLSNGFRSLDGVLEVVERAALGLDPAR